MTEKSAIVEDKARSEKERERDDVRKDIRADQLDLLNDTFVKEYAKIKHEFSDYRQGAIKALPAFIVNNSSNVIGATQLVGEALYFKSSSVARFVKEEHTGTWKAFVYPPINVVEGVFSKSAFQIDWKAMLNPANAWGELKRFVNLEEAARVDVMRQGQLSNRWSARSGFAGMFSMAVATAFPDEKDEPGTREKMITMSKENPLGYAGYRIGKGLMFPITAATRFVENVYTPQKNHHIGDGKREFAGIGMTLTGFFSVLAGFRQPRRLGNIWQYDFNKWQALGGMITTFAGGQLLMGVDNKQGWTNYGTTQFLRLLVLPQSIRERFVGDKGKDPKAEYYFGAQGVFQTKNLVAALIGGAQKLPDGRIVDPKETHGLKKEKATNVAKESTTPATRLVSVEKVERALPEHTMQAHDAEQSM